MERAKLKRGELLINCLFIIMIFFTIRKGSERFWVSFVFCIVIILKCMYKKKILFWDKKLIFSYGIYTVFLIMSYLKNPTEIKPFSRFILCSYFLFFCLAQLEINKKFYSKILLIISSLSLISSYRGFREWKLHSFSNVYRIIETNSPTIYTIELAIYVFISLFCFFTLKNIYARIIAMIVFLFSGFVLIGTHSRVTLILVPMLLIVIFIGYLMKNEKLNYKIIGIIFLSIFLISNTSFFYKNTKRLESVKIEKLKKETRIKIYTKGIQDFIKNNYKGLGFNYYGNHELGAISWEKNLHLHNNILEILVTQGIGSLIFYMIVNILLLIEFIKKIKEKILEEQRIMNYLAIILLIFINLAGVVDTTIYLYKSTLLVSIIYGLSLCKIKNGE